MSEARVKGTCKWFDRKKGYGFIEREGGADIFVHQSELQMEGFRALYPEQEVEFGINESGPNNRACATKVTGVQGDLDSTRPKFNRRRQGGQRKEGGQRAPTEKRPRAIRNAAFVFIKPHAVTEEVKELVRNGLKEKKIAISKEGSLSAAEIDEKKLIDQHYYAIASKATILKPNQLAVPADKFKEAFGEDWQQALKDKKVFNAMDGCKELGVDAEKLNELWAECKKAKKLVKFGGGFYCGKIEVSGKKPVYIFNGFFMSMRSKFTAPGTSIYYFSVHWSSAKMSWEQFRGTFLGPTDPADAPKDSLRGMVYSDWKKLGLKAQPDVGDNGVHASASPFEGLAERMNWMGLDAKDDHYGRELLNAGISEDTLAEWSRDPQVTLPEGGKGSLFDALEDMDAQNCLDKCKKIAGV